jgi:hypothetical protein
MSLLKIWNLKHKYKTTKAQFPRKANGAQSSIKRRPISPKDISSWAWHLAKRLWKNSHDYKLAFNKSCLKVLAFHLGALCKFLDHLSHFWKFWKIFWPESRCCCTIPSCIIKSPSTGWDHCSKCIIAISKASGWRKSQSWWSWGGTKRSAQVSLNWQSGVPAKKLLG